MESREIIDYNGVFLGYLELPQGSTEEQWQKALAPYQVNPAEVPKVSVEDEIKEKLKEIQILLGVYNG